MIDLVSLLVLVENININQITKQTTTFVSRADVLDGLTGLMNVGLFIVFVMNTLGAILAVATAASRDKDNTENKSEDKRELHLVEIGLNWIELNKDQ